MKKQVLMYIILVLFITSSCEINEIEGLHQEEDDYHLENVSLKTVDIYNHHTITYYQPFNFRNTLYVSIHEPLNGIFRILNGSDNWAFASYIDPCSDNYARKISIQDDKISILTRDDTNFIIYDSQDWMNWSLSRINLNLTEVFSDIFDLEYFKLTNNTNLLFFTASIEENGENSNFLCYISENNGNYTFKTIISANFYSYDINAIRITDDHFILSFDTGEYYYNKQVCLLDFNNGIIELYEVSADYVPTMLWLENGKIVYCSEKYLPIFQKETVEVGYYSLTEGEIDYSPYIICENLNTSYYRPNLIKYNGSIFLFYNKFIVDSISDTYSESISFHVLEDLDDQLRKKDLKLDIIVEREKNTVSINMSFDFGELKEFLQNEFLLIYYAIHINEASKNIFRLFKDELITNFTESIFLENLLVPENTSDVFIELIVLTHNHYWIFYDSYNIDLKETPYFLFSIALSILIFEIIFLLVLSSIIRIKLKKLVWTKAWKEGEIGILNLKETVIKLRNYAVFLLFFLTFVWFLYLMFENEIDLIPSYLTSITSWVIGIVSLIVGGMFALSRFKYQEMLNQKISATIFHKEKDLTKGKKIIRESKEWSEELAVRFTNIGTSSVFVKQIALIVYQFYIPLFPLNNRVYIDLIYFEQFKRNITTQKRLAKYVDISLKHGEYITVSAPTIKKHITNLEKVLSKIVFWSLHDNKSFLFKIVGLVIYPFKRFFKILKSIYRLLKYGTKGKTIVALVALKSKVENLEEHMNKPEREFFYNNILCLINLKQLELIEENTDI